METKTFILAALVSGWLLANAGCDDSPPTGTLSDRCPPVIDVRALHASPTWSPDGRTIAYVGPDPGYGLGIYLVDTTAAPPVKIMDGDWLGPLDLAWSPDGARIAMWFQGEIQTIDVINRTVRRWTNLADRYPNWPTWSPDGRYIAFALMAASQSDVLSGLRFIDTHEGTVHAIVRDPNVAPMSPARWSPDGMMLVFTQGLSASPRGGPTYWEIFAIETNGANVRRLTFLGGSAQNPQWSADGQLIFFDFAPEKCPPGHSPNRETWVMRADDSELRRWPVNFGNPRVQFSYPFALSPDGEHVAFVGADATGRYGVIHMMRLDGTGEKQLTFPPDSLARMHPNQGVQVHGDLNAWRRE